MEVKEVAKLIDKCETYEYILRSFFSGGSLDWSMVAKTNYEWTDIVEHLHYNFIDTMVDINDIIWAIFDMAIIDLYKLAEEKRKELKHNDFYKILIDNFETYFDIYTNCIDSHLMFIGTETEKLMFKQMFSTEIEIINNKIGFTEIEF